MLAVEKFDQWGCSSAGRALRSQCRGQGFDPPHLHHLKIRRRLLSSADFLFSPVFSSTYPRNTLHLRPLKSIYSRAFFGITDGRTSSIIRLMITRKALVFLYAQKYKNTNCSRSCKTLKTWITRFRWSSWSLLVHQTQNLHTLLCFQVFG